MASDISDEEVDLLANLARLTLGQKEKQALRSDLAKILTYVEKLQEVDCEGVEPMTHAMPLVCPLADDQVSASLAPEHALAGAPEGDDEFFIVPRILPGGEGE